MSIQGSSGLVRAERGSGTYVEARPIPYPLRARTRFSEIVGAGGREPRAELIASKVETADRDLARRLEVTVGTALVRLDTRRFADRTPISRGTTWLPADRFPDAGKVYQRVRSITLDSWRHASSLLPTASWSSPSI